MKRNTRNGKSMSITKGRKWFSLKFTLDEYEKLYEVNKRDHFSKRRTTEKLTLYLRDEIIIPWITFCEEQNVIQGIESIDIRDVLSFLSLPEIQEQMKEYITSKEDVL